MQKHVPDAEDAAIGRQRDFRIMGLAALVRRGEEMLQPILDPLDRPMELSFSQPAGEAALVSPNSVSWRVFKNPLSLFIGGVTAVTMELAEPRGVGPDAEHAF